MRRLLLALLLLSPILGFAAEFAPRRANPSLVRIVPVRPTPEPDNIQNRIVFPKGGQAVNNPVGVQVQLRGFPIGIPSDFDRRKQIYNDPMGQSMLVVIDNEHPIEIYKSLVDSLDPNNLFFDLTLNTRLPYNLGEGMHVIRAFPDRSYGESLKSPGCYAVSVFYIGSRENNLDVDLNGPYLTYNEPLETLTYTETKPLLLDFYLSNVRLSKDGFKVKVTIDKDIVRVLTQWVPYYLYGLKRGKHTIQLQLIDENNEVVPGLFNDVTRTISIN